MGLGYFLLFYYWHFATFRRVALLLSENFSENQKLLIGLMGALMDDVPLPSGVHHCIITF